MKKTFLALFALLLVLFLASCGGGDDDGVVTEEGMVSLSISVDDGASRKLHGTATTVKAYEVVFKSGSNIYRAEWDPDITPVGTITIPANSYTTPDNAVLFGGSGGTLLAVGKISYVESTSVTTVANIDTTHSSCTFLMSPLYNSVVADVSSTFQILGPRDADGDNYITKETLNGLGPVPTTSVGGYPVFPIPIDLGTTSTNVASVNNNIICEYIVTNPNYAGVKQFGTWTANTSLPTLGTGDNADIGGSVSFYFDSPGAAISGTACTFTFMVDTRNVSTKGLCAVNFEATVRAITSGTDVAYSGGSLNTWYIRGGTTNAQIDDGGNGGAVLLGVGVYAKFDVDLTVSTTFP